MEDEGGEKGVVDDNRAHLATQNKRRDKGAVSPRWWASEGSQSNRLQHPQGGLSNQWRVPKHSGSVPCRASPPHVPIDRRLFVDLLSPP